MKERRGIWKIELPKGINEDHRMNGGKRRPHRSDPTHAFNFRPGDLFKLLQSTAKKVRDDKLREDLKVVEDALLNIVKDNPSVSTTLKIDGTSGIILVLL